jgi:hypothetical protein
MKRTTAYRHFASLLWINLLSMLCALTPGADAAELTSAESFKTVRVYDARGRHLAPASLQPQIRGDVRRAFGPSSHPDETSANDRKCNRGCPD